MKNEGKRFEEDFKNSIPDEYFYYRFRDGTASWDGGSARFQMKNICDCMVMNQNYLMLFELKSTKQKSLPFSMVDKKNLDALVDASMHLHSNVEPLFIVNFRTIEKTYQIDAKRVQWYMNHAERKSIPLEYFEAHGTVIKQVKKRVRYRYFMFD